MRNDGCGAHAVLPANVCLVSMRFTPRGARVNVHDAC
ncbi:hypothetical protein XOCgx_4851 [Xanthomonas oryzae pv. oryzicola]|nr:hypothetical protein XOCgx_4851 [Xanthomonas oryzae pv. oryzicola]